MNRNYANKVLDVQKLAMAEVDAVYRLIERLPPVEKYNLADQLRRASLSVPSNITEGQSRGTTKDFLRFLYHAQASNAEVFTQLKVGLNLNYYSREESYDAFLLNVRVRQMLQALIRSLERKRNMEEKAKKKS